MGAVRRRARRLIITARGRALLADVSELWRGAARGLVGVDERGKARFQQACAEAELLVLCDGKLWPRAEADAAVLSIVRGQGWMDASSGEPVTDRDVMWTGAGVHRRLHALGLYADDGWGPTSAGRQLSAAGVAMALTSLRAFATAPRRHGGGE